MLLASWKRLARPRSTPRCGQCGLKRRSKNAKGLFGIRKRKKLIAYGLEVYSDKSSKLGCVNQSVDRRY